MSPHLATTASLANLPEVMDFVQRTCDELRVEGPAAFAVRLAVEEVCSNIMSYGYAGREAGPLRLEIVVEAPDVVVRIGDRGRPFSPDDASPPDLLSPAEERRIGGLGVYLLKQMMDDVAYTTASDWNHLTMRKRLSGP